MSTSADCPCGSGKAYAQCCQPCHRGDARPPSAEALMRSRYSAFVKQLPDYLLATRHPDQRHQDSLAALQTSFDNTSWLGLTAAFRRGDKEDTLFEKSFFKKEGDQWFYVDGAFDIGRNDPCWCGSGKKYKKCHGK